MRIRDSKFYSSYKARVGRGGGRGQGGERDVGVWWVVYVTHHYYDLGVVSVGDEEGVVGQLGKGEVHRHCPEVPETQTHTT